jgi:MFS family permease
MSGMVFLLTLLVQDVLGLSPLLTGFAFLPTTVAMVGASRIAPRLLARHGPRPLMIWGAVVLTAGMVWLSQVSSSTGYLAGILGPVVLFGLGTGLVFVAVTYAAVAGVRAQESGAASGLLNWMQQVGGSLGVAVLVTVAGREAPGAHTPRAVLASGITTAFTVGIAFTAGVLLLALLPQRPVSSRAARRSSGAAAHQRGEGSGSRSWRRSSEK